MSAKEPYADPDPRFAMCPRCGRPLRYETRCEGPSRYLCTNGGCRFESTRDAVVEALVLENDQLGGLLHSLVKLAIPLWFSAQFEGQEDGLERARAFLARLEAGRSSSELREAE